MKQGRGGVVWNHSVAEAIAQIIGNYGVVHQGVVGAVERSKVGLKGAVMTATVGAGGLENLLVEIREGAHRELGSCFLRFGLLHIGVGIVAFLLASHDEQERDEYEEQSHAHQIKSKND